MVAVLVVVVDRIEFFLMGRMWVGDWSFQETAQKTGLSSMIYRSSRVNSARDSRNQLPSRSLLDREY
jgi:hypothetical protein